MTWVRRVARAPMAKRVGPKRATPRATPKSVQGIMNRAAAKTGVAVQAASKMKLSPVVPAASAKTSAAPFPLAKRQVAPGGKSFIPRGVNPVTGGKTY